MIKVHSYESMGTFDGPGLRMVVFLQGCDFRCKYCANPDTIARKGESKLTDPAEIIRLALNEKPFFGKKGGVTFSGGEPMAQAKALIPLCKELKELGIHTCLDTNGSIPNRHVKELLEVVDLVLLDVKEINPERHRWLTGRNNTVTLETAEWLNTHKKPFWLRYVLVPGITDSEEDIRTLCKKFQNYESIERVEILPYHTLGKHKYEAMNKPYLLEGTKENTPEQLANAKAVFEEYFKNVVVN
ncbi:MAG: pyruvate formate-lyase-activating protein [Bacteroidaceae bacterium]